MNVLLNKLEWRINKSCQKDIFGHLKECADSFIPILSSYVDIEAYSHKIFNRAVRFEAWSNSSLVGLLAVYNNEQTKMGFITNVSVSPDYQNMRIAHTLMTLNLDFELLMSIFQVRLRVNKNNLKALSFYKRAGFVKIDEADDLTLLLENNLANNSNGSNRRTGLYQD